MFRGIGTRMEPCIDFVFDILDGPFDSTDPRPGLHPLQPTVPIECGETITDIELTESGHAFYRTSDRVANRAYYARRLLAQADNEGDYSIELDNVEGFTPYITVKRSETHQWQGVLTDGRFIFTLDDEQTGPLTIEVSSLNRYETGSFDATFNCPNLVPMETFDYVAMLGIPYRTGNPSNVDDGSGPTLLRYVFVEVLGPPEPDEMLISSGSLPPGLAMDDPEYIDRIAGSPTSLGTFPFTVRAKLEGLTIGTQPCLIKVVSPLFIQEISAINDMFSFITGSPPDFFNGALYVVGDSKDDEGLWSWFGKGFYNHAYIDSLPPQYAGLYGFGIQLNDAVPPPRILQVFGYALGPSGLNYVKSDNSPGAAGVYNHDGSGSVFYDPGDGTSLSLAGHFPLSLTIA